MNTNTLAAAVVGFLLGGLTVSVAAELEDSSETPPAHSSSVHRSPAPQDSVPHARGVHRLDSAQTS